MCILCPQPALVVIACPRHRHTIVVATRPRRHARPRHRCPCCRPMLSSSRPPSSSAPSLSPPVHRIDAHCCCQRVASTLVEARTHCCSRRALVVIAPAIVIAVCSRCHPHLLLLLVV